MLQAFDNNPDEEEHLSVIDEYAWKEDIGERGRRIAEWWRSLMVLSNEEWLPCFKKMCIMISLLRQPSSAIVERVFCRLVI